MGDSTRRVDQGGNPMKESISNANGVGYDGVTRQEGIDSDRNPRKEAVSNPDGLTRQEGVTREGWVD